MSHKILEVTILEGRNLKDKDTFGQDDAFIELYLDKNYKQRTATIKDTNSPIWNEKFTL
jgi:Ca2+-dependent lipid-binding protein